MRFLCLAWPLIFNPKPLIETGPPSYLTDPDRGKITIFHCFNFSVVFELLETRVLALGWAKTFDLRLISARKKGNEEIVYKMNHSKCDNLLKYLSLCHVSMHHSSQKTIYSNSRNRLAKNACKDQIEEILGNIL